MGPGAVLDLEGRISSSKSLKHSVRKKSTLATRQSFQIKIYINNVFLKTDLCTEYLHYRHMNKHIHVLVAYQGIYINIILNAFPFNFFSKVSEALVIKLYLISESHTSSSSSSGALPRDWTCTGCLAPGTGWFLGAGIPLPLPAGPDLITLTCWNAGASSSSSLSSSSDSHWVLVHSTLDLQERK